MDKPRYRVCGFMMLLERRNRGIRQLINIEKNIGKPLSYPSYFVINMDDFRVDFERMLNDWIPAEKVESINELILLTWVYKN